MLLVEYRLAVLMRGLPFVPRVLRGRSDEAKACRDLGDGRVQDARAAFRGARYAFGAWWVASLVFLTVWAASMVTVRYGFELGTFRSLPVQVAGRGLFGLVLTAMVISGLIVLKSPGRYLLQGRAIFVPRKFGPSRTDIWLALAVGAIAAATL